MELIFGKWLEQYLAPKINIRTKLKNYECMHKTYQYVYMCVQNSTLFADATYYLSNTPLLNIQVVTDFSQQ